MTGFVMWASEIINKDINAMAYQTGIIQNEASDSKAARCAWSQSLEGTKSLVPTAAWFHASRSVKIMKWAHVNFKIQVLNEDWIKNQFQKSHCWAPAKFKFSISSSCPRPANSRTHTAHTTSATHPAHVPPAPRGGRGGTGVVLIAPSK